MSFRKSHYIFENATDSRYIIPREDGVFASFRHHGGGNVLSGRRFFRARGRTLRPDARGVGGEPGHRLLLHDLRTAEHRQDVAAPQAGEGAGDIRRRRGASPPVPALLFLQPDPVAPAGALPAFPAGVSLAVAPVPRGRAAFGLRPRGDVRPPGLLRRHGVPGGSRRPRAVHRRGGRPLRARERPLVPVLGVGGALLSGVPLRRLPVYGETPGRARGGDAFHPSPLHQVRPLPDVPLGLLARPRHRGPQARGALRHLPDDRGGRALDRLLRPPVGAPVRAAPCRYPGVPPSPRLRAARRDPHLPADARGGDLLPGREGPRRGHPREPVRTSPSRRGSSTGTGGSSSRTPSRTARGAGGRSGSSSASCATGSRSTRWRARSP